MFSDCSSTCNKCYSYFVGGCLAGHGDDDFNAMTLEKAKRALIKNQIDKCHKKELFTLFPELENDDIE